LILDTLVSMFVFSRREIKFYRTNHFEIICQFFDPSKNLFLVIRSVNLQSVKKKLEKIIERNMQCDWFPSGNRRTDTAPNQARRVAREHISGGNWRSIIRSARFSPFSSACENERCHSMAAARRYCSNVVYTPKSNFVIRSVERGTARRYTARTRWNCYRPEVHLTFGTVTTII